MDIVLSSPEERFDEVSLWTGEVDGRVGPSSTFYTCPVCSQQVIFWRRNFERNGRFETSNLSEQEARLITGWATSSAISKHPYVDWYCPKCKLPARVYYRTVAGGKADHGIELMQVVELQSKSNAH
jgi:hypothetical protein